MKMSYIVRYLICTLLVCVTIGISTVPTSAANTNMSLHSPSESFKMQFSWSMFTRESARKFALREKARFEQEFNVSCRIYDEKGFTPPPGGGVTWVLYTTCSPR